MALFVGDPFLEVDGALLLHEHQEKNAAHDSEAPLGVAVEPLVADEKQPLVAIPEQQQAIGSVTDTSARNHAMTSAPLQRPVIIADANADHADFVSTESQLPHPTGPAKLGNSQVDRLLRSLTLATAAGRSSEQVFASLASSLSSTATTGAVTGSGTHEAVTVLDFSVCAEAVKDTVIKDEHAMHCLSLWGHSLVSFNVASCKLITDEVVCQLAASSPDLLSLNVCGVHRLSDRALKAVGQGCSKLRTLDVSVCENLTDYAVLAIARGCPELRSINLGDCDEISNAAISALARSCSHLQSLHLRGCHTLSDDTVQNVARYCPELQSLNALDCARLTDVAIREVAKHCKNLQCLNLNYCSRITDASISLVARYCPKLNQLNVWGCKQITDASVRLLAIKSGALARLILNGCEEITDASLVELARNRTPLTELATSNCKGVSDAGVLALLHATGQHLRSLNVSQCPLITSSSLDGIGNHCHVLHTLDMSWSSANDPALRSIARNCSQLEHLSVAWTDVSDAGLSALAASDSKCVATLRTLDLRSCPKITRSSIKLLCQRCPQLQSLCLYGCHSIDASTIKTLERPGLSIDLLEM